MLRSIYDPMVAFKTTSPKKDYQFLSKENMSLLLEICEGYDGIDFYLTPEEQRIKEAAHRWRQQGELRYQNTLAELTDAIETIVDPELKLRKQKTAYRQLKARLDNEFFSAADKNEKLKIIAETWKARSPFCNVSADILVRMFSFLDQIEQYVGLINKELNRENADLVKAKESIERKIKEEREILSQVLLERIKLLPPNLLQELKNNKTTIASDQPFFDDVCFATLQQMAEANFLTPDQFAQFQKITPPRLSLTPTLVKAANMCIWEHGNESQRETLKQLFNGAVPMPQEGHLRVELNLANSLTDETLNFSFVALDDSTHTFRSFDGIHPVDEALLKSINLSEQLRQIDEVLEDLDKDMSNGRVETEKPTAFNETKTVVKDTVPSILADEDNLLVPINDRKIKALDKFLEGQRERIHQDVAAFRLFTSTTKTLEKIKAIDEARKQLTGKTDQAFQACLENLLCQENITRSRGYFGESTLAADLRNMYEHLRKPDKKTNDPIDTTLYLRY